MSEAAPQPTLPQLLSQPEERNWAMLAQLSILLNLFTGILGPLAALIIYLVYKDRSRYVAYQALQSLLFQLIVWVGGGIFIAILWAITIALSAVLVGLCLIPLALVVSALPVVGIVYCIVAAVKCNQGEDFKYWLIGNWVRSTYTG
jgi:uncharacterized protein